MFSAFCGPRARRAALWRRSASDVRIASAAVTGSVQPSAWARSAAEDVGPLPTLVYARRFQRSQRLRALVVAECPRGAPRASLVYAWRFQSSQRLKALVVAEWPM
eukprot:9489012-Pyramimonas_sp.AAC.1